MHRKPKFKTYILFPNFDTYKFNQSSFQLLPAVNNSKEQKKKRKKKKIQKNSSICSVEKYFIKVQISGKIFQRAREKKRKKAPLAASLGQVQKSKAESR